MTESTKRILRTIYQIVVALITIAPVLVTLLKGTPVEVQVGIFAGWVAAVAAIINRLEDAGILPAWLKGDVVPGEVLSSVDEPPADQDDVPEPDVDDPETVNASMGGDTDPDE